ncbi:hypothetical protein ACP70R_027261 [Stipagrostis hirtigluma subsp. patula]
MALSLSPPAWVAVGLGARLLMVAVLVVSVKLNWTNHVNELYDSSAYYDLKSYKYAAAAAIIGAASGLLQIPIAVYLLFESKRMTTSLLILNISMYADMVVSLVLASGVGAGFGGSNDASQIVDVLTWEDNRNSERRKDLDSYYGGGIVATVFLLIGMLLSMCAAVVSVRLRARAAANDLDDV